MMNATEESTSQTSDQKALLFKIVILGDTNVGKTCLIHRFKDNKFLPCEEGSVIVHHFQKSIDISREKIELQIWDSSGLERNRADLSFCDSLKGVIFVYDISKMVTFKNAEFVLKDTRRLRLTQPIFLLIGNKTDLTTTRKVSFNEGQQLAENNQMLFFECSAKTGENVDEAFTKFVQKIYQKYEKNEKKAVSSKNEINDAQNKNNSLLNWFNGSKNAKPKTNSKEIKEKEDEKIEEKTINDEIEMDESIRKNNKMIEDKMKELIETTEQTIENIHEDLDRKNYRLEEKMDILINSRDTIIETIRVDMNKKMETIEGQMNIFITDLKEKDVKTDEYNETVDVRMNNAMNELKDLNGRICKINDKMDERINQIINDINEREVKIYQYIASIEHEIIERIRITETSIENTGEDLNIKNHRMEEKINIIINDTDKIMDKFREDMSFLQQLKELANPLKKSKNPIFMSGEISFIVEDIFAKKAKYEIIDSECFYGLKEPCKMSVRIHSNDHFDENSLALYLMVWHDELTDQVKWPMSATVDVRLKINKMLEGLSYKLKIEKPFDNSIQHYNLSHFSYGAIFDKNISSENRLTISVKVL